MLPVIVVISYPFSDLHGNNAVLSRLMLRESLLKHTYCKILPDTHLSFEFPTDGRKRVCFQGFVPRGRWW